MSTSNASRLLHTLRSEELFLNDMIVASRCVEGTEKKEKDKACAIKGFLYPLIKYNKIKLGK